MLEYTDDDMVVMCKQGGQIFRRVAMRVAGGQHNTVIAHLDGIRAYVRKRNGKTIVILTDEDLYE